MQREHYNKAITAKDASALKIGVVVSQFNSDVTESMLEGALATLREWRVKDRNITVLRVPGSFEVPYGCLKLLRAPVAKRPDAIVAIGCVIKGETSHDVYIASAVSQGIMDLMVKYGTPIAFGVTTTNNLSQAKARATGKANKGREAAIAAMEMALL